MSTSKSIYSTNKFETFDVWGEAQFVLWSNARFDFELIAELLRATNSVKETLYLLNMVNSYLKNSPETVFFDGTIKALKYLVKNGYLSLYTIETHNSREEILVDLLKKYNNRVYATDIISDIEEPILRVLLLEYPHLLSEVLENKYTQHLIGQAFLKNNITDEKTFAQKVDSGENSIELPKDKNAPECMKCKIIYLSLRILNKKMSILPDMANEFLKLSDEYIERDEYNKALFNSSYACFYCSDDWNKNKPVHLSGCQILNLNLQLINMPDTHMSIIYEMLLRDIAARIGKKYFPESYNSDGFIASLAIKTALIIVLFRTENFVPKKEEENVTVFSGASMLSSLNYAVKETKAKGKKTLKLKKWFADYFEQELDKRVAFIRLQYENGVGIAKLDKSVRIIYLPLFETYKYFYNPFLKEALPQVIKLFKNKNIENSIKDDIFINFVINIQKIIGESPREEIPDEENFFKDKFILLIIEAFENLSKKIIRHIEQNMPIKSYYEKNDLFADSNLAVIDLILNFNLSKNNSFIGYLTRNLLLKIKTSSRVKKTDSVSFSESELTEGFLENIPDITNNTDETNEKIDNDKKMAEIKKYLDNLPIKQKEAIIKLFEENEKLSESERKNKNRGLNKIREMMNTS